MITLEQIRLLEGRISRALELIHTLREENSTLHKGLESAQRRMKELEVMVDGFKSDQKEIESVIVRTLHNLDELEENAAVKHQERVPGMHTVDRAPDAPAAAPASPAAAPVSPAAARAAAPAAPSTPEPAAAAPRAAEHASPSAPAAPPRSAPAVMADRTDEHAVKKAAENEPRPPKEELDIF